jgi:2-C-methyl-D-erythritol 4-phosphate cytidylyltransferase/2-C-methyl-D-erythritol 2,4-cyclodiphosphate synthase
LTTRTEGVDAIVVAAGRSSRMGGPDKLTQWLGDRPLIARSIDALAAWPGLERIVVVTAPERVAEFSAADWLNDRVVAVVTGGERRHESVAAGLAALDGLDEERGSATAPAIPPEDRVVLVHDGARPFASTELVAAIAAAAREHGAAIPVLPVAETVKRVEAGIVVETVDRSTLGTAQTPQGARRGLLRAAFERFPAAGPETWTDEAALLEACRIPVHALAGEPGNLKVTVPADLDRARARFEVPVGVAPDLAMRTGIGSDRHPFGPGGPLALGGLSLEGAYRLAGHSDGDVALHAVADALLGAAGLGDLGRMFPAGPATPAGIASGELLAAVVARVRDAGYRPAGIDMTIVAARPRLASRLDAMAEAIAAIVGVERAAVNVKASSGNLIGMEGAGRGISAQAIVTVVAIA